MLIGSLTQRMPVSRALSPGIAGLLLMFAGCAATSPARPAGAPVAVSGSDVQCTMEKPTGSMLPVRVCTTKAQRDQIDATARDARDQMQRAHSPACPSTQGCAVK